jgi:small-conductance mechanosensitive channel
MDSTDILNEVRNILNGTVLLLGGVLVAPFAPRFPNLTYVEQVFWGVGALLLIVAVCFLVAPAVQQQIYPGEEMITRLGRPFLLLGTFLLHVALLCEAAVLGHFVFGTWATAVFSSTVAVTVVFVWFLLPLLMLKYKFCCPPE